VRIILFVNRDFESNLAYYFLKEELEKHDVKIYYSESVGKKKLKPKDLLEIEFYEKEFFFGDIVATIKQHNIATDFEFFNEDFKSFELLPCANVNTAEFIEEVRQSEPDLFISIRFGRIFRDEMIGIPKKGIINLHSAILPDYRGIMGTLHNLKDSRSDYGCTLHYIDSGTIDTGQIIKIAKTSIHKNRSLLWHIIMLYPLGCEMILECIQKLQVVNRLPSIEQDMAEGNYFSIPNHEDFIALTNCSIASFNWNDYIEIVAESISPHLMHKLEQRNES